MHNLIWFLCNLQIIAGMDNGALEMYKLTLSEEMNKTFPFCEVAKYILLDLLQRLKGELLQWKSHV